MTTTQHSPRTADLAARRWHTYTVPASYFDHTEVTTCCQCGEPLPQYIERDERGSDTARCLRCGALHEAESGRFLRYRAGQMTERGGA